MTTKPGELDLTQLDEMIYEITRIGKQRDARLRSVDLDPDDLLPRLREAGFILVSNHSHHAQSALRPRRPELPGYDGG